jgi:threonine dehydratase
MIPASWLHEAAGRIAPHILKTPLTYDSQHDLYLKWENRQVTGSFKVRGAFNKVLTLTGQERARGIVAASAGNHGQGVALAGRWAGTRVTIFASDHAVPAKVEAMRALGAEVRLVPGGYGEAEQAGLEFARSSGAVWISPYNDSRVIAGQGTLGLEICQELPPHSRAVWVVPAGGGGLVSGIGAALESWYGSESPAGERPRLVAAQSEASAFLHALYHRNTQEGVIELESLADGLAGPVEDGSMTVSMAQRLVADFVLVSEEEIARAIRLAWLDYHERIEGSAAVALAAVLFGKVTQRPAVIVLTGGNIQPESHDRLVTR